MLIQKLNFKYYTITSQVEAYLGISPDTIVLVQDNLHRDILFLTATKSVIGWTALQNSIRIFFHQVKVIQYLFDLFIV
jgi:hypothetical protein